MIDNNTKIAVIGLGYVGLPLAVEFGKHYETVGFDINKTRIDELKTGYDRTLESHKEAILSSNNLNFTNQLEDLKAANFFIVTVPTPIDKNNKPDLTPLIKASTGVGSLLKKGDIVVYESTVYPGCTEEDCVPVLEKNSGLIFNQDFFCGYSPERIVPGDKERTLIKIKKITSGSTPETAEKVDQIYKSIIIAGTYKAPSIRVAEAAKVIENCQRDLNISFVNELSKIFNIMDINTNDVLEAASTKWNFLKFKPGLVGGHCIGVDPHYLAQKAQEVGYHPEIILAGRRMNDSMGIHVAHETIKHMIRKDIKVKDAKCLILGFTFKENCSDIRNTKVIDIVKELINYNVNPVIFDPWVNPKEVMHEYGIEVLNKLPTTTFESAILAVTHNEFVALNIRDLLIDNGVLFDVKGFLKKGIADAQL